MVAYCSTTLEGGTCTDSECPKRHDISHCEPCNRHFPAPLLNQHQSGKNHLRNVASQSGPPSAQSSQSPNTSLPSGGGVPTLVADTRVTVTNKGGLDFVIEGTGNAENPSFSSVSRAIIITKTDVSSSLSVQSVFLEPLTNS
jgi:hypothetical protein